MATKGDRLWGGGYEEATHPLVVRMNASIGFDKALAHDDIVGSVAHATMLRDVGILQDDEYDAILGGLRDILGDIERGEFEWSAAREDVHMNIEAALRDKIGAPAGRLHTARSRNDQVATDERLWLRRKVAEITRKLAGLIAMLADQAQEHASWPMCGYTHLQRAQPVTLGHHLLAHAEAFERDADRLLSTWDRADACPLGSGALAGTTLPIDRAKTSELLGFSRPTRNSLDAVSDRDHLVEAMAAATIGMTHVSRIGEELVLFGSAEFGYVKLRDAFTTGSSLMPQKKNPDMAELSRGKVGRVLGDFVALVTVLKGLPLAYNKDLQEDKEPVFDAMATWSDCVELLTAMMSAAQWQKKTLAAALDRGFLLATDLADALVAHGTPFREAHERVAVLVADLAKANKTFRTAGAGAVAEALGLPEDAARSALRVRSALSRRDVPGAPNPKRVRAEARKMSKRAEKLASRAEAIAAPCRAEQILRRG